MPSSPRTMRQPHRSLGQRRKSAIGAANRKRRRRAYHERQSRNVPVLPVRHGLPFAPTATTVREALEFAATHRLPLIGKPRCGNASHGVVLLRSNDEIERLRIASRSDRTALTRSALRHRDARCATSSGAGVLLLLVSRGPFVSDPSRYRSGREHLGSIRRFGDANHGPKHPDGTMRNPDLLEVGRAYSRALAVEGWKGPMNVQMKRMPRGDFVAYELNGRFTGGTAARTLLGFDEVAEVIARFLPGADFPSISVAPAELVQNYLQATPCLLRELRRWRLQADGAESDLHLLAFPNGRMLRGQDHPGARRLDLIQRATVSSMSKFHRAAAVPRVQAARTGYRNRRAAVRPPTAGSIGANANPTRVQDAHLAGRIPPHS